MEWLWTVWGWGVCFWPGGTLTPLCLGRGLPGPPGFAHQVLSPWSSFPDLNFLTHSCRSQASWPWRPSPLSSALHRDLCALTSVDCSGPKSFPLSHRHLSISSGAKHKVKVEYSKSKKIQNPNLLQNQKVFEHRHDAQGKCKLEYFRSHMFR